MDSRNKKKEIALIAFGIFSVVLMGLIIWVTFFGYSVLAKMENIDSEMENLDNRINAVDSIWDDAEYFYNDIIQAKADYLAYLDNDNSIKPISARFRFKVSCDELRVHGMYIINAEGNLISWSEVPKVNFTSNRFNQLRACVNDKNNYAPMDVSINGDEYRFFASPIDANTMAVIDVKTDQINSLTESLSTWKDNLSNVYVDFDGVVMAIDNITYEVRYCSDEKMNCQNALALGVDPYILYDGYLGFVSMNNTSYIGKVKEIDSAYIICMMQIRRLSDYSLSIAATIILVFAIVTFLVVAYATVLRYSESTEHRIYEFKHILKKKYFNITYSKKLGAILLVGIITIFVVTMYNQTLLGLARCSFNNKSRADEVAKNVEEKINNAGSESKFYDVIMEDRCNMAYSLINGKSVKISKEELSEIAELIGVDCILIYDKNGKVINASDESIGYSLSENEDDQSYAFRNLLNSNQVFVQEPMYNDDGIYMQYAGRSLYDEEKGIVGIIQIGKTAYERERIMAGSNIASILGSVISDENSITFSIDKELGAFNYHQNSELVDTLAVDSGIREDAIVDDFSGYITVDGVKCFANCQEIGGNLIFIATPIAYNTEVVRSIALFSTIVSAIPFLIIYLIICIGNKSELETDFMHEEHEFTNMQSAADRWRNSDIRWSEQTPEQKLFTMISDIVSIIAFIVTIYIIIVSSSSNNDSIMAYVLSGKWEKGFNFFSFTASLMAIAVGCVCNVFVKKLFTLLADSLTARGTTIFRMLRSATKYVVVITVAFYIMKLYGANPKTLLTSAGVLTAIIGLGANSLTSDILAGFFLVFEGEFRVGDIVTIDGWRGVVLDIGIRTTKIEDDLHNIKIIENSKVSGLINMTKKTSLAEILVGIDYGESLERVEEVFKKEFPQIKERIPNVKGGPYYTSVKELGDNAVVLRILAECNEKDRPQLERDINREIKLMFDRNDINVPYPQITINEQKDYSGNSKESGK